MAATNEVNDIVLVPKRDEAAVKPGTQFWNLIGADGIRRGAVVPYEDPGMSLSGFLGIQNKVNLAIRTLNTDTRLRVLFKMADNDDWQCIRFETVKPWTRSGPAYTPDVGKTDSIQFVYISERATEGNVMHELMHVLGFVHEQQRDDRDNHVTIDVEHQKKFNNKKCADSAPPGAPYDTGSIMHYRRGIRVNAEYIERHPDKTRAQILGQRKGLSDLDVKGVGWLYGDHGCTYSAFLDNPCEHKHYLCETCSKHICLYCQETCDEHKNHKVKLVEDQSVGFVCGCSLRDTHATLYETHAHEYMKK